MAFGLVDLLVPLASDWKPLPVAAGVLAVWALVVVQVSSLARRWLSKRAWRAIHLTSYGAYWLASLHGTFAGTDAANPLYVATSVVTLAAVVFAASYRVLTAPQRSRRPGRRERAVADVA